MQNRDPSSYYLVRKLLQTVNEERDLSVCVMSDLKPSLGLHCGRAAAKASSTLGLIQRHFRYIDKGSFLILYKAYIRHLEYCAQSWSPSLAKYIARLEQGADSATCYKVGWQSVLNQLQWTTKYFGFNDGGTPETLQNGRGTGLQGSTTGEVQWPIGPRTAGRGIAARPCWMLLDNRSKSRADGCMKRRAAAGSLALQRTCHNTGWNATQGRDRRRPLGTGNPWATIVRDHTCACARLDACRLLQLSPCSCAKDDDRQSTRCVKCRCPGRQQYQKVRATMSHHRTRPMIGHLSGLSCFL